MQLAVCGLDVEHGGASFFRVSRVGAAASGAEATGRVPLCQGSVAQAASPTPPTRAQRPRGRAYNGARDHAGPHPSQRPLSDGALPHRPMARHSCSRRGRRRRWDRAPAALSALPGTDRRGGDANGRHGHRGVSRGMESRAERTSGPAQLPTWPRPSPRISKRNSRPSLLGRPIRSDGAGLRGTGSSPIIRPSQ